MLARIALACWCMAFAGGSAMAQERGELPTRPGVTQPVLITAAPTPVANVILFPGGNGLVASVGNNFLLRVAPRFVAQGMTVAVADSPSDHPHGVGIDYRSSDQQVQDTEAIIAALRNRAPLPVWLIGTSRGSISAANAAARIGPPRVAGVVLTSSVWRNGMGNVALDQIRMPVLVVHNRDDGCRASPYSDVAINMDRIRNAPIKELITTSGGMLRSGPCEALSPHGYYGIEDQVVPPIIAWIKAH